MQHYLGKIAFIILHSRLLKNKIVSILIEVVISTYRVDYNHSFEMPFQIEK